MESTNKKNKRFFTENGKLKCYDVLIVIDHYLPGMLAGGPITTIVNMVNRLPSLNFIVVTRNYDLDKKVYDSIDTDKTYSIGQSDVIYLSNLKFNPIYINYLARKFNARTVYLNSFFSLITILYLLYNKINFHKIPIILAPRGEFSSGAFKIKRKNKKKVIYIWFFNFLSLYKNIIFQASSNFEKIDMLNVLGPVYVKIAADVAELNTQTINKEYSEKPSFIFLSRIVEKKNLYYAIERLINIDLEVVLDVFGPIEDKSYWQKCLRLAQSGSGKLKISYRGPVDHEKIHDVFCMYDAFIFPTLGENYGHVIYESLSSGCSVILSDQTPWQDLEKNRVGWCIPLSETLVYEDAIRSVIKSSKDDRVKSSERCISYALNVSNDTSVIKDNLALFNR